MHKTKNKFLRWFTLIEMLIVIVIIGILASALIPRISQVRERAKDTARKAHLQQVAAVLVAYQIDKGSYPTTPWPLSDIEDELLDAGLSSIPTDPDTNRVFAGLEDDNQDCEPSPPGQYLYTPIERRSVPNAGFVLMAGTQTEWWSNWVFDDSIDETDVVNNGCIGTTSNLQTIQTKVCTNFTDGNNPELGPDCVYDKDADQLRYIYMQ